MAVEQLKAIYWVDKAGRTGEVKGDGRPVIVPRGEAAVARDYMDSTGATNVLLTYEGNSARQSAFQRAGKNTKRLRKLPELLAWQASHAKRGRR